MIHICKGLTPTDTEIYKTLKDMQPKKWAIERTESNYDEVNKWANKQGGTCRYLNEQGYIHSEPIDDSFVPLYNLYKKEGFELITIEQFREITNPTKINTMNKAELINLIEEDLNHEAVYGGDRTSGLMRALYLAKQLDEPTNPAKGEGELMAFAFPIPEGWEAVHFGEVVTNMQEPDNAGIVAAQTKSKWGVFNIDALRLRPVPPPDWEAEIIKAAIADVKYYKENINRFHAVTPSYKPLVEAVENYLNHKR